ncbi:MAG: EamA family transporter, partial [Planctomycetota bacterium]
MKAGVYKADALLLIVAVIWGTTFVAQKAAMKNVGPMTFTGVRFALGTLVLLPLALRAHRKAGGRASSAHRIATRGGLAGLVLFAGMTCQQVGLLDTTAGKAGFITGLY